jgi:hypothetical protein
MITYERVKIAKEYIEKKYRLKKEEETSKKKGKIKKLQKPNKNIKII